MCKNVDRDSSTVCVDPCVSARRRLSGRARAWSRETAQDAESPKPWRSWAPVIALSAVLRAGGAAGLPHPAPGRLGKRRRHRESQDSRSNSA